MSKPGFADTILNRVRKDTREGNGTGTLIFPPTAFGDVLTYLKDERLIELVPVKTRNGKTLLYWQAK
jgi:hypothetical protein